MRIKKITALSKPSPRGKAILRARILRKCCTWMAVGLIMQNLRERQTGIESAVNTDKWHALSTTRMGEINGFDSTWCQRFWFLDPTLSSNEALRPEGLSPGAN